MYFYHKTQVLQEKQSINKLQKPDSDPKFTIKTQSFPYSTSLYILLSLFITITPENKTWEDITE